MGFFEEKSHIQCFNIQDCLQIDALSGKIRLEFAGEVGIAHRALQLGEFVAGFRIGYAHLNVVGAQRRQGRTGEGLQVADAVAVEFQDKVDAFGLHGVVEFAADIQGDAGNLGGSIEEPRFF